MEQQLATAHPNRMKSLNDSQHAYAPLSQRAVLDHSQLPHVRPGEGGNVQSHTPQSQIFPDPLTPQSEQSVVLRQKLPHADPVVVCESCRLKGSEPPSTDQVCIPAEPHQRKHNKLDRPVHHVIPVPNTNDLHKNEQHSRLPGIHTLYRPRRRTSPGTKQRDEHGRVLVWPKAKETVDELFKLYEFGVKLELFEADAELQNALCTVRDKFKPLSQGARAESPRSLKLDAC